MGIDSEHHDCSGRQTLGRRPMRQFRSRGHDLRRREAGVNPIFQFDTSGKLLKTFGAGMFVSPHKLSVDKEGNLWLADNGGHQVFKLIGREGLVDARQKRSRRGGLDEFDAPTDVAIAPNGDIFVGDGHTGGGTATGNARIMKFNKNGKFIKTWGRKGMGQGEFDVVHTLAFDSRGRLFVGDRQNNRIQIFDQDGKFIAQWFQFGRPSGMYIDKNDVLYVADSESRDGRTNTGQFALPQTGYGYNPGASGASESEAPGTARSSISFRTHVRIRTQPARAWRKA